jgi:hypothetical protein
MRLCYIVLTCKKYLDTRVEWQKKTVFKNVDPRDIFYLGPHMDIMNHIYSWGAGDDYHSLPYKFYDFFRKIQLDYDWYMLMDDDTYVFHDRLVNHLSKYNPNDLFAEGKIITHIADSEWGLYHSGGAGTILSKATYEQLCHYLRYSNNSKVPHWCADISLGYWLKQIPTIDMKNNNYFYPDIYDPNVHNLSNAITFHHLKEWSDYHKIDSS